MKKKIQMNSDISFITLIILQLLLLVVMIKKKEKVWKRIIMMSKIDIQLTHTHTFIFINNNLP